MVDILVFFVSQIGNLVLWLDTIVIYNSLTLLRFILILILFFFIFKVFGGAKND